MFANFQSCQTTRYVQCNITHPSGNYVDENKANSWSIDEVIYHRHQLYSGTLFTQKHAKGEKLSKKTISCVIETA